MDGFGPIEYYYHVIGSKNTFKDTNPMLSIIVSLGIDTKNLKLKQR